MLAILRCTLGYMNDPHHRRILCLLLLALLPMAQVQAQSEPNPEADAPVVVAQENVAGDDDNTAASPSSDPAATLPGQESTEAPVVDGPRAVRILGVEVLPGSRRQLGWDSRYHFAGLSTPTPVLVAHGRREGPTLCLTAALHGDELNGIEIVRRVLHGLDPEELRGTVIGVPIVNLMGFQRNSRYLPDRRDLNRAFPGSTTGSLAARTAHSLFEQVIRHCDRLVDLHTGSFHRTNLVQLRANLRDPEILQMTRGFGAIAVLHSSGIKGSLRRAATDIGIPSVTLEIGEPMRLQAKQVETGVKGIQSLMDQMGMVASSWRWSTPQPVYYRSQWVRANQGGILFSLVKLGDQVNKGRLLATITDPVTNERSIIEAPFAGQILGMAVNQVVMPGFAAFRIGVPTSGKKADQIPADLPAEEEHDADANDPEPQDSSPSNDSSQAAREENIGETLADSVDD